MENNSNILLTWKHDWKQAIRNFPTQQIIIERASVCVCVRVPQKVAIRQPSVAIVLKSVHKSNCKLLYIVDLFNK